MNILTGFSIMYKGLKKAILALNGRFIADVQAQRPQIYGLSSHPLPKTITTVMRTNSRTIVLSEENPQLKIELSQGEVALFDGLNHVKLSRGHGVEIFAATKINIGGKGAQKLLTEAFITAFNTHTHGSPTGSTTPPVVPAAAAAVSTLKTEAL